jgi:predicted RNA-binding protein associated with RNAse of E/G family
LTREPLPVTTLPPRASPKRLEMLGPLTTHFKRRSGKTSHYREYLFYDDGKLAVAGYDDLHVTRPLRVAGKVVFDTAFKAFRIQRKGAVHTTIMIYALDDQFLGVYSDATMPWGGVRKAASGPGFETDIDDLYLDHFIIPGGASFVLDVGEMNEGLARGTISPREAALAMETVTLLDCEHIAGRYPESALAGLALNPRLLRHLPGSQGSVNDSQ